MRQDGGGDGFFFGAVVGVAHLYLAEVRMVETVVDPKDQTLAGGETADLFRQQADGRIGFLRRPELRFLPAPYVYDTPLAVTDTVTLIVLGLGRTGKFFPESSALLRFGNHECFVDISPDRTAQTAGSIEQSAPHLIEGDTPELTDIRVVLQRLIGIASRVCPFVEEGGDAVSLVVAGGHSELVHITVHVLVMHTEDVVDRLAVFHRTGVAEDDRACRVGSLHPVPAGLEVLPVDAFVADRPEQDGRVGTERFHHLAALGEIAGSKLGAVLRPSGSIVLLTVGVDEADGCLTFHVDTEAVAIV